MGVTWPALWLQPRNVNDTPAAAHPAAGVRGPQEREGGFCSGKRGGGGDFGECDLHRLSATCAARFTWD
jgi:hypothetical protein